MDSNIILYGLLGFIALLLIIIAFSKKKIASFDDFKKGTNPKDDRSILGEIFNFIGKFFGFIFSPIMLLIIVFLIGGASTVKTVMIGGETQCGKIVEKILEKSVHADEDDLKEGDYDHYYDCTIFFLDKNCETHSAIIKYNLYQEYLKDPNKTYCDIVYSSEFYMYLVTSILLGVFCIGILIYMNN